MVIKEINYIFAKILKYIHMTAKEELIEKILSYDKKISEKTKNNKRFTICINPEIAKLFREKLEEYNNSLK